MQNNERRIPPIKIEGATLIFKNFRGEGGEYNNEGDRNFGVLLDEPLAEELEADGWNVRRLNPRPDDPDNYRQPWLKVKVKYGSKIPPTAMLINSRGKKRLDEEIIGQIDYTRIANCDLTIRAYQYAPRGGRPGGISAYLQAIYVTVKEDELEEKYADIPDVDEL